MAVDAVAQTFQLLLHAFVWGIFEKVTFREDCIHFLEILLHQRINGGIHHRIDEFLHLRLLDAFKIVSNAHVEYESIFLDSSIPHQSLNKMDDDPSLQIFVISFFQSVLSGPFHIVSFVPAINAWLGDYKLIHDLHRLEFNEPAPYEIAGYYVLCKLGMRTSCRPAGCGACLSKDIYLFPFLILEKLLSINTENGVLASQLRKDPVDQL